METFTCTATDATPLARSSAAISYKKIAAPLGGEFVSRPGSRDSTPGHSGRRVETANKPTEGGKSTYCHTTCRRLTQSQLFDIEDTPVFGHKQLHVRGQVVLHAREFRSGSVKAAAPNRDRDLWAIADGASYHRYAQLAVPAKGVFRRNTETLALTKRVKEAGCKCFGQCLAVVLHGRCAKKMTTLALEELRDADLSEPEAVNFLDRHKLECSVMVYNLLTGEVDMRRGRPDMPGILHVIMDDQSNIRPHWLPVVKRKRDSRMHLAQDEMKRMAGFFGGPFGEIISIECDRLYPPPPVVERPEAEVAEPERAQEDRAVVLERRALRREKRKRQRAAEANNREVAECVGDLALFPPMRHEAIFARNMRARLAEQRAAAEAEEEQGRRASLRTQRRNRAKVRKERRARPKPDPEDIAGFQPFVEEDERLEREAARAWEALDRVDIVAEQRRAAAERRARVAINLALMGLRDFQNLTGLRDRYDLGLPEEHRFVHTVVEDVAPARTFRSLLGSWLPKSTAPTEERVPSVAVAYVVGQEAPPIRESAVPARWYGGKTTEAAENTIEVEESKPGWFRRMACKCAQVAGHYDAVNMFELREAAMIGQRLAPGDLVYVRRREDHPTDFGLLMGGAYNPLLVERVVCGSINLKLGPVCEFRHGGREYYVSELQLAEQQEGCGAAVATLLPERLRPFFGPSGKCQRVALMPQEYVELTQETLSALPDVETRVRTLFSLAAKYVPENAIATYRELRAPTMAQKDLTAQDPVLMARQVTLAARAAEVAAGSRPHSLA